MTRKRIRPDFNDAKLPIDRNKIKTAKAHKFIELFKNN